MRNSIKLFVASAFTCIHFIAFSTEVGKSEPSYSITKANIDKTLKTTESVFEFNFFDNAGKPTTSNVRLSYNGIEKTAIHNAKSNFTIKVKPGKYVFQFYYNSSFLEITTDSIAIKPAYRTEIKVTFLPAKIREVMKKPVIYVYPKQLTDITIKLDLKGKLDFTYPSYNNGWSFQADSNGTIYINNKKYNYLFWEGTTDFNVGQIQWNEGFIVNKENLATFFEEKLSAMGLKSNEIEDYITYWCPLMNVNEQNYVHFIFNEEYNEYAKLTVNPKPEKLFRVFMLWTKADEKMLIKEQKMESFVREGFTVVEWGGTEISTLPEIVE